MRYKISEQDRRYKLELDARGKVICFDESGRRVSLGRCFAVGSGSDPNEVEVTIRKSCELGGDVEREIKERLQRGGTTLWKLGGDDFEIFESDLPMRKKRKAKKKKQAKRRRN